MIETARGVENVEAITEVEGLTGIYLGTMDLAMSLGRPKAKLFEDDVLDAAVSSIVKSRKTPRIDCWLACFRRRRNSEEH